MFGIDGSHDYRVPYFGRALRKGERQVNGCVAEQKVSMTGRDERVDLADL